MKSRRENRWVVVFAAFWVVILVIGAFGFAFLWNNNPFIVTQHRYSITEPIFFYEQGELPNYPSISVWATFTTTNTVGDMFIAGDKVDVSATLIVGNMSNIFQYHHGPTFELGFENALIWNVTRTLNAVVQNVTINVPALMPFKALAGNVYSSPCCTSFYWPTGGNFRPILFIENNDTGRATIVPQNFTSFAITIQPRSVYTTDQYNRVNEALTLALVFFGVVEMADLSGKFYRKAFPVS